MEFVRESMGKFHESIGKAKLYVNDKVVAEGPMRAQVGKFTLCGDGLCIGYDSADAVSKEYKAPGKFKGGKILFVEVNVGNDEYLDLDELGSGSLRKRLIRKKQVKMYPSGCRSLVSDLHPFKKGEKIEGDNMTLIEFFETIAKISGLLFVVTSMLAMGLNLTMTQIVQPLKNIRLVVLALLANFVLVPLLAYLILMVIPLEQSLRVGLIVLSTAAGAPFLPKLVVGAKGNVAFGVGLMVLLMVVTIIYMPPGPPAPPAWRLRRSMADRGIAHCADAHPAGDRPAD